MSYIGQGEDGTWSRWLNPWRDVPGESEHDRVRRATDEYARQADFRALVEKARNASPYMLNRALLAVADAHHSGNKEDTVAIARLGRKVAREADRLTALKKAHAVLDRAVADGLATRLPDQQDPPQEATTT